MNGLYDYKVYTQLPPPPHQKKFQAAIFPLQMCFEFARQNALKVQKSSA